MLADWGSCAYPGWPTMAADARCFGHRSGPRKGNSLPKAVDICTLLWPISLANWNCHFSKFSLKPDTKWTGPHSQPDDDQLNKFPKGIHPHKGFKHSDDIRRPVWIAQTAQPLRYILMMLYISTWAMLQVGYMAVESILNRIPLHLLHLWILLDSLRSDTYGSTVHLLHARGNSKGFTRGENNKYIYKALLGKCKSQLSANCN